MNDQNNNTLIKDDIPYTESRDSSKQTKEDVQKEAKSDVADYYDATSQGIRIVTSKNPDDLITAFTAFSFLEHTR